MFPPHCIAGEYGSEIVENINVEDGDKIIKKRSIVDSLVQIWTYI